MRKIAVYGASALLIVSAVAGATYAQQATETPAIPDTTLPALQQRAWLGIKVAEGESGVVVTEVNANSPAETAQLQVGDVILEVNGTAVASISDLQAAVQAAASGDVLAITVQRGEEELSVDVTLTSREDRGSFGMPRDPLHTAEHLLDVELEVVDGGYQIVSVTANTSFDLAVGDVVTAVNGEDIATVDWSALRDPSADAQVTLTVSRDGSELSVTGELAAFSGRDSEFPGNGQPNPNGGGRPGGAPPNNGQHGGNRQPGGSGSQPSDTPPDNNSQPDNSGDSGSV